MTVTVPLWLWLAFKWSGIAVMILLAIVGAWVVWGALMDIRSKP